MRPTDRVVAHPATCAFMHVFPMYSARSSRVRHALATTAAPVRRSIRWAAKIFARTRGQLAPRLALCHSSVFRRAIRQLSSKRRPRTMSTRSNARRDARSRAARVRSRGQPFTIALSPRHDGSRQDRRSTAQVRGKIASERRSRAAYRTRAMPVPLDCHRRAVLSVPARASRKRYRR